MTSHGSRSMTGGSSEPSDLKKLKSKYSSQLSTLRELFTEWTDDDLLFAIQEADGDLEVAVDRISEGHVFQWGEVKSKKSKKEAAAQKAKAAAATNPPPSAAAQQTYSHRSERPQSSSYRGNSDRSRRGGRGGHGSRGPRQSNNNHTASSTAPAAATWGTAPPTKSSFQPDGDSWAAIASSKMNASADDSWGSGNGQPQQADTANGGGSGGDGPSNTSGGWDDSNNNNNNATTTTTSTTPEADTEKKVSTTTNTSSEPKTWASLLKSQPKPEPEPQPKKEPESTSGWDAPTTTDSWNNNDNEEPAQDSWEEPKKEAATTKDAWDEPTPAKDEWNTTTTTDGWGASTEEKTPAATATTEKEPETITTTTTSEMHEENPSENEAANEQQQEQQQQQLPQEETPVTRKQSTNNRRLKQDAPVVLPNNSASLSSIGVKFGSLNLDDNSTETVDIQKTTLQSEPSRDQEEAIAENQYGAADAFGSAPLKQQQAVPQQQQQQPQQETIPQQAQPQAHLQQQQPHQPHQQQQLFGVDQIPSGYSSYLPNQPPANLSGFGVSPMGSLPEYGVYGTEAHRAAAAMGYYDPSAYSQSPSVTSAGTYQGRDKHNQDGVGSMPQHSGAQTPGTAQQMYPANMPYYPYYYMPNQFGYQQSYGQPFLNKNMYPNMYQHSVGKPSTGSTASPYGAGAGAGAGAAGASGSPYSQQTMYGQSVAGGAAASGVGYDDMSGLQHHLGGMSLHDYQKPYQQQLPGFLGTSTGAGQQPQQGVQQQQQQQQQAVSSQQQSNKNEVTGGQLNKSATNPAGGSNGHHHHHHQPQQQQHQQQQSYQQAMNPGNYFGHSGFPYQQQYPQQHFAHFQQQPGQQQQQQQQVPSAQQPSPMGRQQPYWSQ